MVFLFLNDMSLYSLKYYPLFFLAALALADLLLLRLRKTGKPLRDWLRAYIFAYAFIIGAALILHCTVHHDFFEMLPGNSFSMTWSMTIHVAALFFLLLVGLIHLWLFAWRPRLAALLGCFWHCAHLAFMILVPTLFCLMLFRAGREPILLLREYWQDWLTWADILFALAGVVLFVPRLKRLSQRKQAFFSPDAESP